MLKISELSISEMKSSTLITALEKIVQAMSLFIDQTNSDASRSPEWKKETIKAMQEKTAPAFAQTKASIDEVADTAAINHKFWQSKVFLLSIQKFSDQPEKDAQIRMAYSNELAAFDLPLLALTMENARIENNLPLFFQCWKTGSAVADQKTLRDMADLSLNGIEIPNQAQALEIISRILEAKSRASQLYEMFYGRELSPLKSLQMARQQQMTEKVINHQKILN
ncbi:hypothetical protein [Methylovulum psychrotolerans]|uniref:Uncharacterized protein n=1 Tax=Methylovulum psychrotolerans TaxID=1704499 RepID=A0A2S5CLL6_9GAMM|nr:hypothetical protein [Methylovulum psychrotolerans]POZ51684.1 hypothetical protein AADEFJLK_02554 [Methylovulum psychrotolerans]